MARGAPVTRLRDVDVVSGLRVGGVAVTPDAAELNLLDGATAAMGKLTGLAADAYPAVTAERTFTETTGAGTYTGSVTVPAGATILDIQVQSTVLWDTLTSATMKVGDAADDDGWYIGINLKATDLLVGEVIRFGSTGGKEGAYLVAASGLLNTAYSASARVISGIVTTVGATGSAGRTRMLVVYTLPTASAATKV